ncbi:hypothetical protein PanWU01x14_051880 [Parasponia andersonii]|uniref:Secreted protein n=1 Tax=Parasponia andersonii TaxID=3476 RepID=A0A2P5DM48_PARAD|nr:hypothetical protein PanWU01x14_051880 [Parasponia andersonii]
MLWIGKVLTFSFLFFSFDSEIRTRKALYTEKMEQGRQHGTFIRYHQLQIMTLGNDGALWQLQQIGDNLTAT